MTLILAIVPVLLLIVLMAFFKMPEIGRAHV